MSVDLPFHRSWFDEDEINELVHTLKSGWLTTGPKTIRFEEAFQDFVRCKHAIALNSCTAGLHLALAALEFKHGSEVITTPMTFPATANVVVHEKLHPVFVDIEPGTLNINVNKIEEKLTSKTRAIVPVHYAGHPCEMDGIKDIAECRGLKVVEDAAHALEARYKGSPIGSFGNMVAFSFYANKNITTGEGGMLAVPDEEIADKIRILRLHGLSRDAWKRYGKTGFTHWQLEVPGYKYNMPDINAALGIHQLKKVEKFYALRKRFFERYNEAFRDVVEIETLQIREDVRSALHIYVIALRLDQLTVTRDQFLNALQESGIGSAVHYVPLHLQPFYAKTYDLNPEDFPIATDYAERILTLPLYPRMAEADVDRVAEEVVGLIKKYRR